MSSTTFLLELVVNWLWSCLLVAPLVVTYWRGTWDLLEDLVYPPVSLVSHPALQNQLSGLVCYLLGLMIRICLDMTKHHFANMVKNCSKLGELIISWIFTAIYALIGVSFWRGVWFLMKMDVGIGTEKLLAVLFTSFSLLLITGVSRSLISSPLALCLDSREATFTRKSFISKSSESDLWLLLDVIFTNLVVRQLIVFCWWSLWSLLDSIVPSISSLPVGYLTAAIVPLLDHVLQSSSFPFCFLKICSTLVTVLSFLTSVIIWRGIWSILNLYFLPNMDHDQSYLISHLIGLAALSILKLSNTIANDSIADDIETEEIISITYWKIHTDYEYSPVKLNQTSEVEITK